MASEALPLAFYCLTRVLDWRGSFADVEDWTLIVGSHETLGRFPSKLHLSTHQFRQRLRFRTTTDRDHERRYGFDGPVGLFGQQQSCSTAIAR